MSIKYKVMKRAEAGVKGGGQPKYYAMATQRQTIDYYQLAIDISSRCTLRQSDVISTLVAMSELIPEYILNGYSIKLNKIGILSAMINTEGKETPAEVTPTSIKGLKMHFRPDNEIKKQLKLCEFSQVEKEK